MAAWQMAWWVTAVALACAGCLLDDDRCGPHQVEYEGLFNGCICAENAVPEADGFGCKPCSAGEEAQNGQCVPAATDAGGGADGDAGAGDSGASSGVVGQGMTCTGPADCASFDATYCQMLQEPYICLVQDCATGERTCASDRVCCDLSALVPDLAAANGLCVPDSQCTPFGGTVVTP